MADVDKVTVIDSLDIHKRSVVGHVLNVFFDKNENKFVAESRAAKQVPRTLTGLGDLADFLREFNVHTVVMESSGPYSLVVYYFLESEGFDVWMVPARDNKSGSGKRLTLKMLRGWSGTLWLARLEPTGFLQILRLGH